MIGAVCSSVADWEGLVGLYIRLLPGCSTPPTIHVAGKLVQMFSIITCVFVALE